MKQLPGLDATFLYMETPSQFGHVSGLSVFARPDTPGYDPFTEWKRQIEARLHLLEPLRRRVVEVPFGIDHPYWINDPDFDIDYHVRATAIPPPGNDEQLANLVARIVERPLDRRRPLWETYVIEGLPDGNFAVLTKIHHATVDGASGAELLTLMLDDSPDAAPVPPPVDEWTPEAVPNDLQLLARATANLVRKPGRAVLLTAGTMRELGRATRNPILTEMGRQMRRSLRGPLGTVLNLGRRRQDPDPPPNLPRLVAPRSPFNQPISAHRRFALRSASLDTVKQIKNALGATVNDVVMAVCAGALREWLLKHDALPEEPLSAMVPISVRTGQEPDRWTNRVSALAAALPTDEPDPVRRVERVHEAMVSAKELWNALPAEQLTNFSDFSPPAVFSRAVRLATRLSARTVSPFNLVVSNVPGPRQPLYAAGARLLHYYPVSTIVDGQGLNITVQSYLDVLDFGLIADRDLVPDLWTLADHILADIDRLAATTAGAAGTGERRPARAQARKKSRPAPLSAR